MAEFNELAEIIARHSGIILSDTKRIHIEHKISNRIRQIGLPSFDAYIRMLRNQQMLTNELPVLMDIVTTNKTDFFREPAHFNFLTATALQNITDQRPYEPVKIWSAGCSTGEEPYSLAMVLNEYALMVKQISYSVYATDISPQVIEEARLGVYVTDSLTDVSPEIKHKYFLKSKNPQSKSVRVVPELRSAVSFSQLNLMDDDYRLTEKMDCIFCRNVIIYFDKETQERVVRHLADCLAPGGYLFLGHSETILGMNVPLVRAASTIYRKKDA